LCSEADSQHTSGDKEITLSQNQCPGKVFRTSMLYCAKQVITHFVVLGFKYFNLK
jgi:hypothetical protein